MQARKAAHETVRKELTIARANDTIDTCTPVNLPAFHYHCLLGSCGERVTEVRTILSDSGLDRLPTHHSQAFPCPDCKAVVYCSAACLAKAQDDEVIEWKGVVPGHKQDCAQLKVRDVPVLYDNHNL